MQQITLAAHAKINLTLDVTGRREDGYHTVEMVMQEVALHDDVTVSLTDSGAITLTCDNPDLPTDSTNLAYRAAALFYQTTATPLGGCHIALTKRIPAAAGLAGGSTDAAAVLKALNALHGTALRDQALCEMGLQLGADVPFCLLGGTMLAQGIGEILSPLAPMPKTPLVLCKPPVAVSTPAVYRAMDETEIAERPDTAAVCAALKAGDRDAIAAGLCNVMEPVTASWHPEIAEIRQTLLQHGAIGARMSGSGPTVYGLFRTAADADRAAAVLKTRYADTVATETR